MATKMLYLFDPLTGVFLYPYEAQESPEEPGEFIEPTHSTAKKPLADKEGKTVNFINGKWAYQVIEVPDEPIPELPVEAIPAPADIMARMTESEKSSLLNYLASVGVIAEARKDELLAPGTA